MRPILLHDKNQQAAQFRAFFQVDLLAFANSTHFPKKKKERANST